MTLPFATLEELMDEFPDEASCIAHLEYLRWKGFPTSPFDPLSTVYTCEGNEYKCRNSNKYFNVRTGTIFEDSKVPLRKWFVSYFLYLQSNENIAAVELSRKIGSSPQTAKLMIQRFKHALNQ